MSDATPDEQGIADQGPWNYHPVVPISTGGIFRNLLNPFVVLKGIFLSWFGLYVRGLFVLLITAIWLTIFPTLAEIAAGPGIWMLEILLINMVLMLCWAGGLHLYFYRYGKQGAFLRFSVNTMETRAKFTFGDQVWDNMSWTLAWGVPIWTAYECGLLWMLSQGMIPGHDWDTGAIWFIAFFVLIPFWDSAHFFTVHRFLHSKWLYGKVHSVHHRNIHVGPWSGLSMHPVETAIYLSVVVIHLVLPSHPVHIVFHITWYALGPAATHCGFEAISVAGGKYPRLGDFFHQLHHEFFECNYGNSEVPLDRMTGNFHDGTRGATKAMRARMKLARQVRS